MLTYDCDYCIWLAVNILKSLHCEHTVHFVSYHFDIAVILSDLFLFIMDTGGVLCDFKTDILYVLNYSDEFLASNILYVLTLRLLMSYIYIYIYIYGAPILDVSRSHTTTHHSR